MKPLWIETIKKHEFEALQGDTSTDTLIIGGGLAGILCAYMLKESGIDCILIEAKEICSGITKNTTAKVTAQHGLIYDKIISKYGKEAAKQYYYANNTALERYRALCRDIDCDFEVKDAYVYSTDNKGKLEKEIAAYHKMGVDVDFCDYLPLPIDITGAIKLKDQAQINPLKFLYEISKTLNIKENTKLLELLPHSAKTDKGNIKFKNAIIATHFPIINKHGFYFLKMYQHRSYVIALEQAKKLDGIYIDENMKGLSFRNYKDLLLLGGGSHRTGKNGGSYNELLDFAKLHYPEAKEKYRFATQDCMTLDNIPYIGRYSKNTPNLYVATGFNKWGFTTAMAAAKQLCDMISGKDNHIDSVFSPNRSILHPQLAVNSFEAIINILTPTAPRCPHLGCALKYNKNEHTWDCPCHGSRFESDGTLIDNPATDDKKI